MERLEPRGNARLAESLNQLAITSRRRDVVVVCSDLWEDRHEVLRALSLINHRGGEVIVLHILHPHELDLPRVENGLFIDSESSARIRLQVNDIRDIYKDKIKHHLDDWSAACRGAEIDYRLVTTDMHYSEALENYLYSRAAMT